MLRRVAAFCRPLRPMLLLVSFPRSRSPVVGPIPPPFGRGLEPNLPPFGGGTVLGLWVLQKSVVCGSLKSPPPPPPGLSTSLHRIPSLSHGACEGPQDRNPASSAPPQVQNITGGGGVGGAQHRPRTDSTPTVGPHSHTSDAQHTNPMAQHAAMPWHASCGGERVTVQGRWRKTMGQKPQTILRIEI